MSGIIFTKRPEDCVVGFYWYREDLENNWTIVQIYQLGDTKFAAWIGRDEIYEITSPYSLFKEGAKMIPISMPYSIMRDAESELALQG